jgi:hypothetical protein
MIVAGKEGEDPMHLYIDEYALRQNWVTTLHCDPNNPNNTFAQERTYRFGFNGHENDNELKGRGNHLGFGDYGYDSRLGRRLNIEPYIHKFPAHSSYSTHFNNPIYFTDEDGNQPLAGPSRWHRIPGTKRVENDGSITYLIYDHITKKYWWINQNGNDYKYYTRKTIPANILNREVKPGWHYFPPNKDSYEPTAAYAAADKMKEVASATLTAPVVIMGGFTGTCFYTAFKHYSLSGGDISKIDFVDASLDLLPVKKLLGNLFLDVAGAAFDFQNGEFSSVLGDNSFKATSAEALSGMVATFLMSKHSKQLEGALKDSDPEWFKKLLPELTNATQDFIKEVIVNKVGEDK